MSIKQCCEMLISSYDEQCTIYHYQAQFALILEKNSSVTTEAKASISPQLGRRLQHLIEFTYKQGESTGATYEIVCRISSVYSRLLLELIQAHYNTKQREQDLIRLVNSRGCTILDSKLTDAVIDNLVKLFKAAGQCTDTSFERIVLIKFLLKELADNRQRQVEKVVQTLYKSSCFHIIKMNGAPGRLKLKDELCNIFSLRQKHDIEMIKLAQEEHIRISPESWAYLLHQSSHPDDVARMQSLLDKHQEPPRVAELQSIINRVGDRYSISNFLNDLEETQNLIEKALNGGPDEIEERIVIDLMKRMLNFDHLFTIRQCRGKPHVNRSSTCKKRYN